MSDLFKNETVMNLNFLGARDRLRGVIRETPLSRSDYFSKESGNNVYIKAENLQVTGAFKLRGAYNKVAKLTEEERERGIITSSAGNHAQGVAFAAKELGVKATIVMPTTTPLIKVEGTKNYGVDVVLSGDVYDEAYKTSLDIAEANDYVYVHAFNDIDVIEGQGTIAIEILDALPEVDIIMVPVGGGGLVSGIAACAKTIKPSVKIIGVEPEGADSMQCSLRDGHVVCLDSVSTIADGAAVKEPGDLTYAIVSDYVDEFISVSDYELMEAFIEVMEGPKYVGESAGLLAIAALKKLPREDKNVVAVLSGGNIDMLTVSYMVNRGLVAKGRMYRFSVDLPDKPGELLAVAKILADCKANVVEVKHDQMLTKDRFNDVVLEVTIETNGFKHIEEVCRVLEMKGYAIHRSELLGD